MLYLFVAIQPLFMRILLSITLLYEYFNAVGVALLIAQGCQTIVQATLGERMLCVEQRHRCCAFFDQFAIYLLVITMPSQKKLNTYSVESPCERLPRVGSYLANPGLSKAQHLRRCTMSAFILPNTSI